MSVLFEKIKQNADRICRCYLTLDCDANCYFCSAQIPLVKSAIRSIAIEPDVWAEGLNRRKRHTILAGGEPLMYRHFHKLIAMLEPGYKIEIYTNLNHDIDEFLAAANRPMSFLISLHPSANKELWLERARKLHDAKHGLRFHIVRAKGYEDLGRFLTESNIVGKFQTALQGDQRAGPKCGGIQANKKHPHVICSSRIYLYGPDGYRYHCVHKMTNAGPDGQLEHISNPDAKDWSQIECQEFGFCAGCDNNIEGKVTDAS